MQEKKIYFLFIKRLNLLKSVLINQGILRFFFYYFFCIVFSLHFLIRFMIALKKFLNYYIIH